VQRRRLVLTSVAASRCWGRWRAPPWSWAKWPATSTRASP